MLNFVEYQYRKVVQFTTEDPFHYCVRLQQCFGYIFKRVVFFTQLSVEFRHSAATAAAATAAATAAAVAATALF